MDCVQQFRAKANGFVAWELMIGRDNCQYPWGNPDGSAEPAVPFHGVIDPDGHPWSIDEIKALLGDEKFAALEEKSFKVEYYDGEFKTLRKTSIAPSIDVSSSAMSLAPARRTHRPESARTVFRFAGPVSSHLLKPASTLSRPTPMGCCGFGSTIKWS